MRSDITYFVATFENILRLTEKTCPVCHGIFFVEDIILVRHIINRFGLNKTSYFHRKCWKDRYRE